MNPVYSPDRSDQVVLFLEEIAELSRKYHLSLSHEDPHGSFLVYAYDPDNIKWLLGAGDATGDTK